MYWGGVCLYKSVCAFICVSIYTCVCVMPKMHHYAFMYACGVCLRRYVYIKTMIYRFLNLPDRLQETNF